jgi:hypothetical protein
MQRVAVRPGADQPAAAFLLMDEGLISALDPAPRRENAAG